MSAPPVHCLWAGHLFERWIYIDNHLSRAVGTQNRKSYGPGEQECKLFPGRKASFRLDPVHHVPPSANVLGTA
ncbi:MAG TPA: hypothetical protein VKV79_08155, partial [Terriglobia bacterium]|nr:hypothetical protein [Terriglobia bacterium]